MSEIAKTGSASSADRFSDVRMRIRNLMAAQNVPSIALAVAHEGGVVWEEGFGWADLENRVPATARTLYALASISKPITATALMILVERGAIDLDKPIDDYLGSQKLTSHLGSAREATVRRIANHTAGLPLHYHFFYADELVLRPTMDESIKRYGVLVRPPGESYVYSNFGYALLEYAIERVSGTSYAQFLRDELFVPLGLTESAVSSGPDSGGRVALRYRHNRPVPAYDSDHRGASAVLMSAHDLVRFGMFHLHGRLAGQHEALPRPVTLELMREDVVPTDQPGQSYGIGWSIGARHGLRQFGHAGGMAGVATHLTLYPEADIAVAVLGNTEAGGIHDLESSVVHALLPETIHRDHGFKPEPEVLGLWRGAIRTHAGQLPIELEFEVSGRVFARIGAGPRQEVIDVRLDTQLSSLVLGGIVGDVGAPEAARYPCQLDFSLRLRPPDRMTGAVSTVSQPLVDRIGNALSCWVDLRR